MAWSGCEVRVGCLVVMLGAVQCRAGVHGGQDAVGLDRQHDGGGDNLVVGQVDSRR